MAEPTVIYGRRMRLDTDGAFPLELSGDLTFDTIETRWAARDVAPAGLLVFTADGDPGVSPGEIDLAATGSEGSRVLVLNGRLNGITISASGLPAAGAVLVKLTG